jgi:hypothetical protein
MHQTSIKVLKILLTKMIKVKINYLPRGAQTRDLYQVVIRNQLQSMAKRKSNNLNNTSESHRMDQLD